MGEQPKSYFTLFGNYPKEYNRAVHGPYYPWVNYGPKDTPLSQVKLGELKNWYAKRNKTPQAAIAAISRAYHNWSRNWVDTRFGSPSKSVLQILIFASFTSFICSYGLLRHERRHKYHW